MSEQEILECNKLIAEFMGGIYSSDKFIINRDWIWLPYKNMCRISNLKYYSSWDWLMPAVSKIGKMYEDLYKQAFITKIPIPYDIETTYANVICRNVTIEIEHLFERVVEFVKWYNKCQMMKC